MDLFTGAVGTGQVHDFNPGIRESGLFWTQPVSEDALEVDLAGGTATLALDDLDEEDYHNLLNALLDGPSDSASVSFEMRWLSIASRMTRTQSHSARRATRSAGCGSPPRRGRPARASRSHPRDRPPKHLPTPAVSRKGRSRGYQG